MKTGPGTQFVFRLTLDPMGKMYIMALRVAEFSNLEIVFPKNQHTQRKLLNFENWVSWELSKIGRQIMFKGEEKSLACSLSNKICRQLSYQSKSDYMDRGTSINDVPY